MMNAKRFAAIVLAVTPLFIALPAAAQLSIPGLDDYSSILSSAPQNTGTASPVDLLYDADGYAPSFYPGRTLPAPGTSLHLQAIAHFLGQGGSPIPDNQITYTWRVDDEVQGSLSGLGKSSIVLASPSLYASDVISVDAASADGTSFGSASLTIPSVDPSITLYEDHPLFGIEYYDALGGQTSISDTEATFAAVPYFAQAANPDDPALSYAWQVNGLSITPTTTPSEITINADNSTGVANVALALTSPSNYLLDAQGAWAFIFSGGGTSQQAGSSASASNRFDGGTQ